MRPISQQMYGIPRERVIGSSSTFAYTSNDHGGTITHHPDRPTLRLPVLHDDAEREFDYTVGAQQALSQAETDGWTVVSIKNDWATVFRARRL